MNDIGFQYVRIKVYNIYIIFSTFLYNIVQIQLEMVNLGPARGPKRAGTGRAGPENPGPRAFTGLNGPYYYYYLRVLCLL